MTKILLTAVLACVLASDALASAIQPADGPAMMGRGFVLQELMTGLAVALGPTPYALFFFALEA